MGRITKLKCITVVILGLLIVVVGYSVKTKNDSIDTIETVTASPLRKHSAIIYALPEPTEVKEYVPKVEEPKTITYRVTAYCACVKCCGKWAIGRPIDENGNEIVKGAAGVRLVNGYHAASPLPFGTKVDLAGYGVVEVQDRTAKWIVDKYGENIIDIYINDHEKAWNFGVKYWEGVVIES